MFMISTRVPIVYVLMLKSSFFLQNQSERFVFITEWYDPNASLFRRYELLYYPGDGSVEMVNEPFFVFNPAKEQGWGGRGMGLPFR